MARKKKTDDEEKPELVKPPVKQELLIGHALQLKHLESDFNSGRPAQSWLVTGARGIGKATCVYSIVRRVLALTSREQSLPENVSERFIHRIGEGGHSDLKIVEVEDGKEITVDKIRNIKEFMHLTAAESAWRVAVIDGAEAMNASAANALLKLLEEPPAGVLLFLISHSPGRLLPTIRSRCRKLAFMAVSESDFSAVLRNSDLDIPPASIPALYAISRGSPGVAIKLHLAGGVELYEEMTAILKTYPDMPIPMQLRWAEKASSRQNKENWEAARHIFMHVAHRLAMAGHFSDAETPLYSRLAAAMPLDYWAALWEKMGALLADNDILHFDQKQMALEFFHKLKAA